MRPDTVYIRELKVKSLIGILPHERCAKQTLIISIDMGTDFRAAAASDDVRHALDYAKISDFIIAFAEKSAFGLLETFAAALTDALFAEFAPHNILLDIQKPGAVAHTRQIGIRQYRENPQRE